MTSLVLELQQLAQEPSERLSDLLRRALVVATKLKLNDFREWVEHELRGYETSDVPRYRVCRSHYFVKNPYHGLQPIVFPDDETERRYCEIHQKESVEALQHVLAKSTGSGDVVFSIPPASEAQLRRSVDLLEMPLVRLVSTNNISAVLDTVRTTILEWALRLESEGILGEDLTFSIEEKHKAHGNAQISIQNFHGILGDVDADVISQDSRSVVLQGDLSSLNDALGSLGLSDTDYSELKNAIEEDPVPTKPEKFGPKVGKWIGGIAQKAAEGGMKVGVSVASSVLSESLKKYYGLS